MRVRKLSSDLLAIVALGLRAGGQLMLFPLLLRLVPTAEIGIWYALTAIGAVAQSFDLGVSAAIIRMCAAFHAGASFVPSEGFEIVSGDAGPNREKICSLWGVAGRFYLVVSVVCVFAMIALSFWTVWPKLSSAPSLHYGKVVVLLHIVAAAVSFYSTHKVNLIRGLGDISLANLITIASAALSLLLAVAGILFGAGIMSLSFGLLVGGWLQGELATRVLRGKGYERSHVFDRPMFMNMIPNGIRMAVLCLSGYVFSQTNLNLTTRYLSLEDAARLGVTNQVAGFLAIIAGVFVTNRLPAFTSALVLRDYSTLRSSFYQALLMGFGLYLCGAVAFVGAGPFLLKILGSKTSLLPLGLMVLIFVSKAVESLHDQYANLVMAENKVPFVLQSIVGVTCMVILNTVMVKLYGLEGLLWASFVILCFVYTWYPVFLGEKLLRNKTHVTKI